MTRNGGFAPIESIDGKTLYFSRLRGGGTHLLLKMPVDGGAETHLGIVANTWGDFDVTDRGIYYVSPPEPKPELRFLSFAGGAPITLATPEKRTAFGLAAAPGHRDILYTQFDTEASELVRIENFR